MRKMPAACIGLLLISGIWSSTAAVAQSGASRSGAVQFADAWRDVRLVREGDYYALWVGSDKVNSRTALSRSRINVRLVDGFVKRWAIITEHRSDNDCDVSYRVVEIHAEGDVALYRPTGECRFVSSFSVSNADALTIQFTSYRQGQGTASVTFRDGVEGPGVEPPETR